MISKTIHFAIFAFAFCISYNLMAQTSDEPKTLLGNSNLAKSENIGFFTAPSLGLTSFDHSTTALFHARAGVSLKNDFLLAAIMPFH